MTWVPTTGVSLLRIGLEDAVRRLFTRPVPRPTATDEQGRRFGRYRSKAVSPMYPAIALIAILAIDALTASHRWPIPALGLLDDTAHLLTAALILAAIGFRRVGRMLPWALLGSVLIDLDHLPLYTFAPNFVSGGRPPTHSLATPAVLLILAAAIPRRSGVAGGLALGVCLHFVRDIATGPGVALLWPLSSTGIRIDYRWYIGILIVAVAGATWRMRPDFLRSRASTRMDPPSK